MDEDVWTNYGGPELYVPAGWASTLLWSQFWLAHARVPTRNGKAVETLNAVPSMGKGPSIK